MSKHRAFLAAGMLSTIAAAALGVAVLPAFGQTPSAEQIVRRVADRAQATTSFRATLSVSSDGSMLSGPLVAEVWSEKPGKARAEVRQSPIADLAGAVAVSDGTTAWMYSKSKNQVVVGTRADLDALRPNDRLPTRVLDLNAAIDELFNHATVRVVGSETIDGVGTYKLEVTPKPGTSSAGRAGRSTVWVDQVRNIPIKAVISTDRGVFSVSAKNIELNPKLEAALWRFTPPPGAEVVRAADLRPQSITLDQARALPSPKVLIPETLPAGASLAKVERIGDAVVQSYTLGRRSFTIWSGSAAAAPRLTGRDVERVTVRTVPGALREADGVVALTWSENGFGYAITGALTRDEALRLATSLK